MAKRAKPAAATAAAAPVPYELKPGVLITFRPQSMKQAVARLADSAGVKNVAYAADFSSQAVDLEKTRHAGMVVFNSIGCAVLDVDPDQEASIAALTSDDTAVASIEPEPIFFAFDAFADYLRGYRDAVNHLYDRMLGGAPGAPSPIAGAQVVAPFQDTDAATWGLIATKVLDSAFSGRGARVAVLDTGFDLDHPDFRGRQITHQSFIPGQTVDDDNGHGTHCIGTACGPRSPVRGRRYGVASDAEIFVGKVLTNQGSALGRSTLAGIEWAVANRCHIVSMSLGGTVQPGQSHSVAFESTAREALRRDTLIVAAAGNDSRRSQGQILPVSSPANCPSIMAVAALDSSLRTADFSNSAINSDAQVDIAGPGVQVYSSAPEPAPTPQPPRFRQWSAQYDTISGTSMATPHVAGILALLRQEFPSLTAAEHWRLLTSRARALPQPAADVGAGLVQA